MDIPPPERWAPIAGHPNYEVSDRGRVRSLDHLANARGTAKRLIRGRILRPDTQASGHRSVRLGRGVKRYVHDLVATAFIGRRPRYHEVRHKDGDPGNNFWRNLEWSTRGRNSQDKKHHAGQANYKLSPQDVSGIKFRLNFPYHGIGADLAREFGVSQTVISAIRHDRIHRDIV